MRGHAKALFVIAALCSFCAIGASPAFAGYGVIGGFGTGPEPGGWGTGDGQLNNPGQVDVNDVTGNVYVADNANDRVQVFKPTATSAEYDSQLAITAPTGLAIDQSDGSVYVATASGIAKFTAALAPAGGWTDPAVSGALAVDPFTGDLLVADTGANLVRRFNSDGSADGTFAATRPVDLAANSDGDVFVVTTTGDIAAPPCGPTSAVERFSGAGVSEGTLTPLTAPGAVAVDPDDDTIAVGAKVNEYFCELGNQPEVVFFDADGSFREASVLNQGATMWSSIPGLTMQGGDSTRAYAITRSPVNDEFGLTRAFVFEDLDSPVVTIGAAANVAPFSATLHGEVNPEGTTTTCRFEYSVDTSFSQSVPCSTGAGSGTALVPVQANLSGLTRDTTYNFRLVATNNGGAATTYSTPASFTTTHAEQPVVTIAPPTEVVGTTANLSGTIDPLGNAASYRFEYQLLNPDPAPDPWIPVPGGSGSAGSGTGPVTKEAELKGLFTLNTYRVRLSATNGVGTSFSTTEEFTTPSASPVVETMTARQLSPTSAMLRATINPAGERTTYYFEYGTSTSYDMRLPVGEDASAGSGDVPIYARRTVGGLQPSTVYHFRVVAENGTGVSPGEDQSFMTPSSAAGCANEPLRELQGSQFLPDCRAYEMISPPQKNGIDISGLEHSQYGIDFTPMSSVSGDQAAFTSHGTFAGAKSNTLFTTYRAVRGQNGWTTEVLTPYANGAKASSPMLNFRRFSDDLGSWFLEGTYEPKLTEDAIEGAKNSYFWTGQEYRLLTPGLEIGGSLTYDFAGWSEDRDKIVFGVYDAMPLTPEAPDLPSSFILYEWDAGTGELALVGKQPGTDLPFSGSTEIATPDVYYQEGGGHPAVDWNPVSDDGSKVYFYAPVVPNQQLYLRLDGTTTVHVSAPQTTPDENGTKPATFNFATPDGETVFFSSGEKLTADATTGPLSEGSDLYRYDVGTETLTDITVDADDANGAEVEGVMGGSDDGKRLYFVAKGVLAPGGVAGENNLYLWTDDGSAKGAIEFLSTGVDRGNWFRISYEDKRRTGRVTSDGMHALFASTDQLGSYDNDGHYETYLYDAASDEVTCVSCNPSGAPATADALPVGTGDEVSPARTLSVDGRFVFFGTVESLVPTDVNNRLDAYRYDSDSDRVDLISPGTGAYPAEFQDASADGTNALFTTRQQVLTSDEDTNVDVYGARIGGGFASQSPPPPPVPCFGEDCRTEPVIPPAGSNPASSKVNGKGNVKERGKAKGKKNKKGKANGKKGHGKKANGKKGKAKGKKAKGKKSKGKKTQNKKQGGRR